MKNIVIIGGSGAPEVVKNFGIKEENLSEYVNEKLSTPDFLKFQHEGKNILFVLRHGKNHTKDPARLEPKYLAEKLSFLVKPQETLVVQTSASGSLDTSIDLVDEGGIVVCDDVMRGFGFRGSSRSIVDPKIVHAVIKGAYSERARELALDAIGAVNGAIAYDGGIYIENEGNRFESPSEVADLYARLDTPRFRLQGLQREKAICNFLADLGVGMHSLFEVRQEVGKEITNYQGLANSLRIKHAQMSMNAAKELEPLVETGFKDIVLLAFPVNYGVGLIPDEQVNHERTEQAIGKATLPYIVPTLTNMIQMAPDYIK